MEQHFELMARGQNKVAKQRHNCWNCNIFMF